MKRSIITLVALLAALSQGCTKFDAPPQVTVAQLEDGILPDPQAPVVLQFAEPVVAGSLVVKIVKVDTDDEGELLPDVDVFFDSTVMEMGTATLSDDRTRYTIDVERTLPVGPRLGLLISPGLADDEGNEWTATQLIEFAYGFTCDAEDETPTTFPSAVHFMLVDVEEPLSAQLQLIADIRVNEMTGTFIGQFTNADRDQSIDCSQFGLTCADNEVCRTLPEPACVVESERVIAPDEYPDFTANNVPPSGYSFTVRGCVRDQDDGSWAFTNDPVDVEVAMPQVVVSAVGFNASFAITDGVLRGDGTFTALDVLLGADMISSGPGAGSVRMRDIPTDEIKPGVPGPPSE